jgi:hypothetical protein
MHTSCKETHADIHASHASHRPCFAVKPCNDKSGLAVCMLVALQRIRGGSSGQQWLISGALQLCKLALLATVGAQHSSVSCGV